MTPRSRVLLEKLTVAQRVKKSGYVTEHVVQGHTHDSPSLDPMQSQMNSYIVPIVSRVVSSLQF
jgi:hypothetical protein